MVTVVSPVRHNHMVEEMDSHHLTGLLDALCQHIVGLARGETARRVVMTAGEDGGIGKYGLLHDDADVC